MVKDNLAVGCMEIGKVFAAAQKSISDDRCNNQPLARQKEANLYSGQMISYGWGMNIEDVLNI